MKTRNKIEQSVEDIVYLADRKVTDGRGDLNLLREELNKIFKALNAKYRKPFLLFFRGYHYDEISEEMELPIGTIKSRIHYARKKLKAKIRALYTSEELIRA